MKNAAVALVGCLGSLSLSREERMAGVRLPPLDLDYSLEIRDFPTWVAESNGAIVGGLTMIVEGENASVANIGVRGEYQGQGLGGGLMSFAEAQARERGYSCLHLATHVLLFENESLYLHLGWTEIERDERRIRMRKSI